MDKRSRPHGNTAEATPIPALISIEGLADHWRVRPDTLRFWCRTGKLPHIKIGRKILIRVAGLERMVDES